MTLGEPTTASAPSTSGAGVRKPSGPAPRGYTHWDAVHGVWRNDDGEAVKSAKERQAEALGYGYKKEEEAYARRRRRPRERMLLCSSSSTPSRTKTVGPPPRTHCTRPEDLPAIMLRTCM